MTDPPPNDGLDCNQGSLHKARAHYFQERQRTLLSSHKESMSLLHEWIASIRPSTHNNDWDAIEERCYAYPHEAAHLDRRGRTCLHAACAKRPPVSTIRAILQACNTNTILERDNHGRTPLAIAISSNADLEVIGLLLRPPEAAAVCDHLGHLPLHLACAGYDAGQVELVQLLLQAFPEAASQETFNGRTPLHSAMEAHAPVQVVEQLVQVYPEAVVKDGCGLNPLFVAIRFNAEVEVVRCLVKAYPASTLTRDRGNGLPLRRAIENQSPVEIQACLCTSREVVLDADPYVYNTALHGALDCGTAKESTVELLVRTAPEIALTRSKSGQTPLNLACQRWQRLQANRPRDEGHLSTSWRIVERLMKAAFYGASSPHEKTPALHAAVYLQIPLEATLNAIHIYKREAAVWDNSGRYPLQLAIENRPPVGIPLALRSIETYMEQKEVTIHSVLHVCPKAASLPSASGRYALSLAAGATSISFRTLKMLWCVDPTQLERLDPVYGLYPFQIAALPKDPLPKMTSEKATEEWRKKEDLLQLSSIFELLEQKPDLVLRHLHSDGN